MSSTPRRSGDRPATLQGLAGRLRALRELTRPRISQTAAARAIGASQNKVSRAETGQWLLKPAQVAALARLYGADATEVRLLVGWAEALQPSTTSARVILHRGSAVFAERVRRAEEASKEIRAYQPTVVLGVLQTEAVAMALQHGDREAVAVRMARNSQMLETGRKWLLVQTEGALLCNVAGAEAMAEQLDLMIAASQLPNVDLRIITHEQIPPAMVGHGFHIYDRQAVMVGILTGSTMTTEVGDVNRYLEMFELLSDSALAGAEARAAMRRVASTYRRAPQE